jgi:UDP-2,4-diacetamido-2,4,6-trideoxy-beta-L-altropyranose hydrolase
MSRTLIIRADASAEIGTGHVLRCLALAQRWQAAAGRAVFVLAEATLSVRARLAAEGCEVILLAVPRGSAADAERTAEIARVRGAHWIVADGYGFGAAWQQCVRAAGLRLMAIDDGCREGGWAADTVLNPNLGASAEPYARCGAETRLLLGARFALLRREFTAQRPAERAFAPGARRVLVTFGGSDPAHATADAVAALQTVPGLEVVVVAGGSNPRLAELEALVGRAGAGFRLAVDPADLPELMAQADVAVSAAGSTAWELAFLGLPAVLVAVADNQRPIAAALDAQGAAVDFGRVSEHEPAALAREVAALLADADRRRTMSARGRMALDGRGADRVAAALGAPLRVTLVTDPGTWFNAAVPGLKAELEARGHAVSWRHDPAAMGEGDLAFFLSLGQIVRPEALRRHAHNLVVHASAVPAGRGWSPVTWQVLEGKNEIPFTLLEAGVGVDSGDVYLQSAIRLSGAELVGELREAQAAATLALCRQFVAEYPFILAQARAQTGAPSYYRRRGPADSRLDPDKTLREQFALLRVSDPENYPAHFELAGRRYAVWIAAEPAGAGGA